MQEALLRIAAPSFVAGVIFRRAGGAWMVAECAPIVARYVRGRKPADVLSWLTRVGYAWEWVAPS